MGQHYNQLSVDERRWIYSWHTCGRKSIREIARLLNRSHSTISRELKRHSMDMTYSRPMYYPNLAEHGHVIMKRQRGRRPRLKNEETRTYVIEKLKLGWTPEIIAGRLLRHEDLASVCHESIYQFIYKEARHLIECLPRRHKKRKKKYPARKRPAPIIAQKTSIDHRPETANQRLEYGHWESDSIVSAQHKPGCNVIVERLTRMVHITKLSSQKAATTAAALAKKLTPYPDAFVKSITYDNGSENAHHHRTNARLACDSYFCAPYHSWEKGSVEQANSLIRRFFPKKTDFTTVPSKQIQEVEYRLNSRPRKCLNFKTPYEVYSEYHNRITKNDKFSPQATSAAQPLTASTVGNNHSDQANHISHTDTLSPDPETHSPPRTAVKGNETAGGALTH